MFVCLVFVLNVKYAFAKENIGELVFLCVRRFRFGLFSFLAIRAMLTYRMYSFRFPVCALAVSLAPPLAVTKN